MGFVDNYTPPLFGLVNDGEWTRMWLPADTIASLWTARGSRRGRRWAPMPVSGGVGERGEKRGYCLHGKVAVQF